MAAYYEEKLNIGREAVVVCVPHSLYSDFLSAIKAENNIRADFNRSMVTLESLRSNVKRLTKGAISYADFRAAYF